MNEKYSKLTDANRRKLEERGINLDKYERQITTKKEYCPISFEGTVEEIIEELQEYVGRGATINRGCDWDDDSFELCIPALETDNEFAQRILRLVINRENAEKAKATDIEKTRKHLEKLTGKRYPFPKIPSACREVAFLDRIE